MNYKEIVHTIINDAITAIKEHNLKLGAGKVYNTYNDCYCLIGAAAVTRIGVEETQKLGFTAHRAFYQSYPSVEPTFSLSNIYQTYDSELVNNQLRKLEGEDAIAFLLDVEEEIIKEIERSLEIWNRKLYKKK